MRDSLVWEAGNAFEFSGYYAVQAFSNMLMRNGSVNQLAFGGGDAQEIERAKATLKDWNALLDYVFANDQGSAFVTIIRQAGAVPNSVYTHSLKVDFLDFTTLTREDGFTGVIRIPFSPKGLLRPFTIQNVEIIGLQSDGELLEDPALHRYAMMSFMSGASHHPDYEQVWVPHYRWE
jgi:hypothetical protein